jgi:putative transposase
VAFVDDHKERFGVEPVCRVLSEHGIQIAANSYYAHKKRPASARSVRDARVLTEIVRVHTDPTVGRGLYGVRKVHAQRAREGGVDGRPVSRRQVERLMRTAGLQGARRGRKFTGDGSFRRSTPPPAAALAAISRVGRGSHGPRITSTRAWRP